MLIEKKIIQEKDGKKHVRFNIIMPTINFETIKPSINRFNFIYRPANISFDVAFSRPLSNLELNINITN